MLLSVGLPPVVSVAHDEDAEFHALLFTKTEGFRHDSIPAGIAAVEELANDHGFAVDHTEDSSVFTEENLDEYDVVVWLNTTGNVLTQNQQEAFEGYIQAGGGYVGIHSASDTHYEWPWYGGLVGAYFQSHPPGTQTADVMVGGHTHLQMVRRYERSILLNPGSVGLAFSDWWPKRVRIAPWAEYAILTVGEGRLAIELHRTTFDVESFLKLSLSSGMPHAQWWVDSWSDECLEQVTRTAPLPAPDQPAAQPDPTPTRATTT